MSRVFASLRFRLVLLVLLAVVPAIGVVTYSAFEQRRLVTIQTQENALRSAKSAARTLEQLVESTRQLLTVLAQFPVLRANDQSACSTLLANLLSQYPRFSSINVSDLDGNLICNSAPLSRPVNISDDSFVPHVIETRDFAVGEYRIGPASNRTVLGFGYPIVNETGQIQSVVIAAFYVSYLNELTAESPMPPNSVLTIRDRKGVIVARYPDPWSWVGRAVPDAPGLESIPSSTDASPVLATGNDGVPRLYAYASVQGVPTNDLFVSVGIPTSIAFAEVNQVLERNLLLLALIGTVALAAAWIGGDWFLLRHVDALSKATRRMADGDLSARTGVRYGVGELSQLARSFDRMVDVVEQRQTALTHAEDRVRRWASHLEGLINTVADASSQPLDASKIVDVALDRTISVMNVGGGCVLLKRGDRWSLAAHNGLDDAVVQAIQQLTATEAAARELGKWTNSDTVQGLELRTVPEALSSIAAAFPTCISVPIKSKGRLYGLLFLAGANSQLPDAEERRVLCAVGRQLGVAIENADLYGQVRSMAAIQERERLGRELHDGLAQVLGYLVVKNKLATDLMTGGQVERAEQEMREMQQTMEASCREIRESILGLRVTVAPNGGLMAALREYLQKYTIQTGVRLTLIPAAEHLVYAPETEVQLLRIIQEALSNIRKHSAAKQGSVRFERRDGVSIVTIEDQGTGFEPEAVGTDGLPHYGLQTMRERAESVGGSLAVSSSPGRGTHVVVSLPIEEGE